MADIRVSIAGDEALIRTLELLGIRVNQAIEAGLTKAFGDAVKSWRMATPRRTGRLRRSLHVRVQRNGARIRAEFFNSKSGFYYPFQRDAPRATATVEKFLRENAGPYVTRELQRALASR